MSGTDSPLALRDVVADAGYAQRSLELIATVARAASPAEALEVLLLAKTQLGAEQAVFVSYIRDEDAHESYRFLLAADPRWCFEYQAKAWYGSDPWLLYASLNSDVVVASRIAANTHQQHEVLSLARRHGMVSVCIAPAASNGQNARVGMLALGSKQEGYFEGAGFEIFKVLARSLAMELHDWWSRYERQEIINARRITDEDLELLKLELDGYGTKKASDRLGLSIASIDSRWQRLNRKLGAPHRQLAARLAAKYGLI